MFSITVRNSEDRRESYIIQTFDDKKEALDYANRSEFALAVKGKWDVEVDNVLTGELIIDESSLELA